MMPGFRVLAAMKRLRGTPLDLFGYTHERRIERALIGEYEQLLDRLIANLVPGKLSQAAAVAGLAGDVRGYGHVKDAAIERYRTALTAKLADYDRAPVTPDGRAPVKQAASA